MLLTIAWREDKRYYMDYTGTGNTLNANLPHVLRLMMDSLRYWIVDMYVEWFPLRPCVYTRAGASRGKIASALSSISFTRIQPSRRSSSLPSRGTMARADTRWASFRPTGAEWNGKYRDCIRDYWRGADSMLGEFAERFTGSSDLYQGDYRRPTASINFITAHDGFTLHDLVSYNEKTQRGERREQ